MSAPTLADAIRAAIPLAEAGIKPTVSKSHPEEQSGHEDACIAVVDALRAALPRAEAADALAEACEKHREAWKRAETEGMRVLDMADDALYAALRRYRGAS